MKMQIFEMIFYYFKVASQKFFVRFLKIIVSVANSKRLVFKFELYRRLELIKERNVWRIKRISYFHFKWNT